MANLFLFASNLPSLPENNINTGQNNNTGQIESLSYGVQSETEFRVTSSFNINNNNVKAYAITSGIVLLLYQKNNDNTINYQKVNLILKPNKVEDLKLPVKYFIYRGLRADSFVSRNNNTDIVNIVQDQNNFMSLIYNAHINLNPEAVDGPISPGALGLPSNDNENTLIDSFFFTTQNAGSQLLTIPAGTELGVFGIVNNNIVDEIGLDIVLEGSDFPITVGMANKPAYIIGVNNTNDPSEKKWRREEIHNYVDPAAFYGMHSKIKGGIGYCDGTNFPSTNGISSISSNILSYFQTHSTIYLDLRNENGYSYNYYENYTNGYFRVSSSPEEISNDSKKNSYGNDGWPIHIINNEVDNGKFYLSLNITDYNNNPIIVSYYAPSIKKADKNKVSKKKEIFLINKIVPENGNYTIPFEVNIPYEEDITLAGIVRFDYIKCIRSDNNSTHFPQRTTTDFLFGPVNSNIPWDTTSPVKWKSSNMLRYINSTDEISIMKSGMAIERNKDNNGNNVIYYTYPQCFFKKKKAGKLNDTFFEGGTSQGIDFFKSLSSKDLNVEKEELSLSNNSSVSTLKYTSQDKGNVFFLCLTEAEKDTIDIVIENYFSEFHHPMIRLVCTSAEIITDKKILYQYDLYVSGTCDGVYDTQPVNGLTILSTDNKIYASSNYINATTWEGESKYEVHFKRINDDKTCDHFLFDYLREDYINTSGKCIRANIDTGNVDSNNIPIMQTFENQEAKNLLIEEYGFFPINKKRYYIPWLYMHPDHHERVENIITERETPRVVLELKLITQNKLGSEDYIEFRPSHLQLSISLDVKQEYIQEREVNGITYKRIPANKAGKTKITIKCTAPAEGQNNYIAENGFIEIYDGTTEESTLIGKLGICQNYNENESGTIDLGIVKFLQINFEGSFSYDRKENLNGTLGNVERCIFNFGNPANDNLINVAHNFYRETKKNNTPNGFNGDEPIEWDSKSYTPNNYLVNWKEWLRTNHKTTMKLLSQLNLSYTPDYKELNNNLQIQNKIYIRIGDQDNGFAGRGLRYITGNNNQIEIYFNNPIPAIIENGDDRGADRDTLIDRNLSHLLKQINNVGNGNPVATGEMFPLMRVGNDAFYYLKRLIDICEVHDDNNYLSTVITIFPIAIMRQRDNDVASAFTYISNDLRTEKTLEDRGYIFLSGYPPLKKEYTWILQNHVLAHEIAHRLLLHHSFLDDNEGFNNHVRKKFIFNQKTTDNVMDYAANSHGSNIVKDPEGKAILNHDGTIKRADYETTKLDHKISFWKWQMLQARRGANEIMVRYNYRKTNGLI